MEFLALPRRRLWSSKLKLPRALPSSSSKRFWWTGCDTNDPSAVVHAVVGAVAGILPVNTEWDDTTRRPRSHFQVASSGTSPRHHRRSWWPLGTRPDLLPMSTGTTPIQSPPHQPGTNFSERLARLPFSCGLLRLCKEDCGGSRAKASVASVTTGCAVVVVAVVVSSNVFVWWSKRVRPFDF